VTVSGTSTRELAAVIEEHPYQFFPLVRENRLEGLISRTAVIESTEENVIPLPAHTVSPDTPVKEAVNQMVADSANFLVLMAESDGRPLGIVTLHDVLRAQTQIADQF
jgi:CBS domain-containing protein